MSALNPVMVGQWDGCNLWVQWEGVERLTPNEEAVRYLVRVRMRAPGKEWGAWNVLGNPSPKCFRVVQTQREGWEIQADVAVQPVMAGTPPVWESAAEVTFDRAKARFRFDLDASRPTVVLPKGLIVSATVDGAGCSYRLREETELLPGVPMEMEMDALHFSGWCQLDFPGHFLARIAPGLTVTNLLPSMNDLLPTVRDGDPPKVFTKLARLPHPGGPGVLVANGKNWLMPTAP